MLCTSDSVSEPVHSPAEYYPVRWLPSGQAYEFSNKPIASPPPIAFFNEFKEIIGTGSPLGICCVDKNGPETVTETNDGKKSYTQPGSVSSGTDEVPLQSAWLPGRDSPLGRCYVGGACGPHGGRG